MAAAQGTCRFCGQQILVEDGEGMTEPQRDECATLHCECDDAKVYQEAALRRDTAKRRLTSYSEKERANTDSQTK